MTDGRRITLSTNEVLRVSQWALRARGIVCGTEDEPAEAVAWLAARDPGAVSGLLADLRCGAIPGPPAPRVTGEDPQRLELDAGGASALLIAPIVLDWLQASAAPALRIDVRRVASPAWWLPHVALRGRSCGIAMEARDAAGRTLAVLDCGPGVRLLLAAPAGDGFSMEMDVTLARPSRMREGVLEAPARRLDSASLEAVARASLRRGISIDAHDWSCLEAIAYEAYVPESADSRSRGAGGGDDNE